MKTYQDFVWNEPEALSDMNKQIIIQHMQNKHGFAGTAIIIFLVMLPIVFIAKNRFDLSFNGVLLYLILHAVLSIVISYTGVKNEKNRVAKLNENNFVWRYGTVTRTRNSRGYNTNRYEVDGQSVSYIFGASEGDTVFVIGFDTTYDPKTKATFYAVSVNL
jgi:hypothetical protein